MVEEREQGREGSEGGEVRGGRGARHGAVCGLAGARDWA